MVKLPPFHGGDTGSIPVRAMCNFVWLHSGFTPHINLLILGYSPRHAVAQSFRGVFMERWKRVIKGCIIVYLLFFFYIFIIYAECHLVTFYPLDLGDMIFNDWKEYFMYKMHKIPFKYPLYGFFLNTGTIFYAAVMLRHGVED